MKWTNESYDHAIWWELRSFGNWITGVYSSPVIPLLNSLNYHPINVLTLHYCSTLAGNFKELQRQTLSMAMKMLLFQLASSKTVTVNNIANNRLNQITTRTTITTTIKPRWNPLEIGLTQPWQTPLKSNGTFVNEQNKAAKADNYPRAAGPTTTTKSLVDSAALRGSRGKKTRI